MKYFRIAHRPVQLFTGVLELTRAQAAPRLQQFVERELAKAHRAAKCEPDTRARYTIDGAVSFKAGEVIGFDGDVPKAWDDVMVGLKAIEQREAVAAAAAQAAHEAAQASAVADAQHRALLSAMRDITPDAEGNIDIGVLTAALDDKLEFQPTVDQLEAAWTERVSANS